MKFFFYLFFFLEISKHLSIKLSHKIIPNNGKKSSMQINSNSFRISNYNDGLQYLSKNALFFLARKNITKFRLKKLNEKLMLYLTMKNKEKKQKLNQKTNKTAKTKPKGKKEKKIAPLKLWIEFINKIKRKIL